MGYVQGVSIPYHHQNTQDPSTQIALSIIMMNKNEANWSTFLKSLKLGKTRWSSIKEYWENLIVENWKCTT